MNQTVLIKLIIVMTTCSVALLGEVFHVYENVLFAGFLFSLFVYCMIVMRSSQVVKYFRRRKRRKGKQKELG